MVSICQKTKQNRKLLMDGSSDGFVNGSSIGASETESETIGTHNNDFVNNYGSTKLGENGQCQT